MSPLIRTMAAQDLDCVMALAAATKEAPRWTRRDYEAALSPAPHMIQRAGWVAESGGGPVGFAVASFLPEEGEAEMESVVVEAQHRRRGIGGALLTTCRGWAAQQGALTLRLEVRASNVAAVTLYQAHGFRQAGLRHAYYSAPVEDALLLRAPVSAETSIILEGFGRNHGS